MEELLDVNLLIQNLVLVKPIIQKSMDDKDLPKAN